MKNHWLQIRLLILAASLLTFAVQAQQVSDEENIKALRTNIQRMVANAPPATAPDENHRKTLLSLRGQLVRLLLKKSGALESRIGNLEAPGALPEVKAYAAQLRSDLKAVNDEIGSLDQALGGTLPAPLAATPEPTPDPAAVAKKKNFENLVASISPSDLATAALPDAVASTPPSCNVNGTVAGPQSSAYDRALCQIAAEVVLNNRPVILAEDQVGLMTILVAKLLRANQGDGESYAAFVTEAQENRIDQQMGAGPTSNSATSIVSKGGIPYLLGFAVENGAATRTEKDTSITFRLNPGGLVNLFADRGFITGYQASENDPLLKFLRKSSIGLTFDTSRGDTPDVFTGRGQQLSEISARYEFFNDRDPRKKKYAAMWEQFVANEMVKLSTQIGVATDVLLDQRDKAMPIKFTEPALEAWFIQLNKEVSNIDPALTGAARVNAVAAAINAQADKVPVALVSDTAVEAISGFGREFKTYTQRKNELLDTIAKGRIFTIEYTNKREVNAPDTSNFNFIYATGNGRKVDLTANGSFTFFHSRPDAISPTSPRPGRIRDFQFAAQVDIPLRGDFDFWFSGRYERLMEDASLGNGLVLPGTKGDIAVGQLGLNVPIKSLGMKFPVSVTFANRTELVKEKVVKGNFGFTFNWDTLLSKLKPF